MNTNPRDVTAIMLVVGFLLATATIYMAVQLAKSIAQVYGVKLKHARRFTLLTTGAIALLLGLSSMGELTGKDSFVVVPLAILLYFYLSLQGIHSRNTVN